MKKLRKAEFARYKSKLRKVPHCDIPRSPRAKRNVLPCDIPVSSHYKFKKREITTIQEEVIHYKQSKPHSTSKEKKAYSEKVASLKNVVKRLKHMCVAKKDVVGQNKIPEVVRLFSDIELQ